MTRRLLPLALLLAVALTVPGYAQKATEIYIPIGESPGVSGKYSVIGTIDSHDEARGMLKIRGESGEHAARITGETKIWLDRSGSRATNRAGTQADCRAGRYCEVRYVYDGEKRTDRAEWIKIRAD